MTTIQTTIFFGCLLAFSNLSFGQTETRSWSDGKLSWADFKTVTDSASIGELNYQIDFHENRRKSKDTLIIELVSNCYLIKENTWINKAHQTAENLKYFQIIFDIAELHRRKFQKEASTKKTKPLIQILFDDISFQCQNLISEFKLAAREKNRTSVMLQWERLLEKKFNQIREPRFRDFKPSRLGCEMGLAASNGNYTGELANTFRRSYGAGFEVSFNWKDSYFFINSELNQSKMLKSYLEGNQLWNNNMRVGVANIGLTYGHRIFDNSVIRIIPFAGLGITEFSNMGGAQDDNLRMVSHHFSGGIVCDYNFRKTHAIVPTRVLNHRNYIEFNVRARVYMTRVELNEQLNGYSINLSLGFSTMIKQLKIRSL